MYMQRCVYECVYIQQISQWNETQPVASYQINNIKFNSGHGIESDNGTGWDSILCKKKMAYQELK